MWNSITPKNSSSIWGFSGVAVEDSDELEANEMKIGLFLGRNWTVFSCFVVVGVENSGGRSETREKFMAAMDGTQAQN